MSESAARHEKIDDEVTDITPILEARRRRAEAFAAYQLLTRAQKISKAILSQFYPHTMWKPEWVEHWGFICDEEVAQRGQEKEAGVKPELSIRDEVENQFPPVFD